MDSDQKARQEVLTVEKAWVDAHRCLDPEALAAIMADDYVHIQADGRAVGKEEDLASYRSGQRHWTFAESDQYDLRIYGETAVLVGRWRARGENAGRPFNYAARFLAVYVRGKDGWRMTAAQSTPLKENS